MSSNQYCVSLGGRKRGGVGRVLSRDDYRYFGRPSPEDEEIQNEQHLSECKDYEWENDHTVHKELAARERELYTRMELQRRSNDRVASSAVVREGRRATRISRNSTPARDVSEHESDSIHYLHYVSVYNRKWIDKVEEELYRRIEKQNMQLMKFDHRASPEFIHDMIGTSAKSFVSVVGFTAGKRVALCQSLEDLRLDVTTFLDSVAHETLPGILRRQVEWDALQLEFFDNEFEYNEDNASGICTEHRERLIEACTRSQRVLSRVENIIEKYGSAILVGISEADRVDRASQRDSERFNL